jgi:hypothetical protein
MEQRDGLVADTQRLTDQLRYSSEDLQKAQAAQEGLLRERKKHQQELDEAVAKVSEWPGRERERERERKRELVWLHKQTKQGCIHLFTGCLS